MNVIKWKTLEIFCTKHADVKGQLQTWYDALKRNSYGSFQELKADFPSVDSVGNERYVFNIKGNKYRLVAQINFRVNVVRIRFIGTHAEYDKLDAQHI